MCRTCIDNLLSVFEFKRNCLESEIQINKYIQQVQHTGDLNLVEVVQQFHKPDMKDLDIKVKIEDLRNMENFKNEDLVCDTSECTDSTEPKYLLKLEKVDMEDAPFKTFDDYNINYDLPAAKENSDAHNSNIAQNCLPEVFEWQNNFGKNLNKSIACYQCCRCGHKAESKLKLILHLKQHTRKNFHHEEIISKTLSRYHKNLMCYYRCSLCNYLTKYKCLFDFHSRIHLIKKNYKHIFKLINVQVYTKAFCSTIKANNTNIKSNKRKLVKNCNNYYKYSFKNCGKSKKSKQHLSHRKIRGDKLFLCSVCEYKCSWKSRLKQHILIHTGGKPFSCYICEYQSNWKSSLKKHILIHTGNKPFSCSVCKYQCSQKSHLKTHMLIHTGDKPFSCSVCEYQSSWKSCLKRHMLTHSGEKSFSCFVCKYQCSQKSDLKEHVRIHTGEKPFKCSVCKYQCSQRGRLKTHMLIHTGGKPFSCSICEYQCSQKGRLKTHMLIHTGEKPFSCSVCEYQSSWKSSLKRHMQIHT